MLGVGECSIPPSTQKVTKNHSSEGCWVIISICINRLWKRVGSPLRLDSTSSEADWCPWFQGEYSEESLCYFVLLWWVVWLHYRGDLRILLQACLVRLFFASRYLRQTLDGCSSEPSPELPRSLCSYSALNKSTI